MHARRRRGRPPRTMGRATAALRGAAVRLENETNGQGGSVTRLSGSRTPYFMAVRARRVSAISLISVKSRVISLHPYHKA